MANDLNQTGTIGKDIEKQVRHILKFDRDSSKKPYIS